MRPDQYAGQADVYDIVHTYSKNHDKETALLLKRVRGSIGRDPDSWLDVACGTGQHLQALSKTGIERLAGIDNSPAQISGAKRRLAGSGVDIGLADMRHFTLQEQFDVVSCLFSSVGHLETDEDYLKALQCMANHVAPKGVVIVEPWIEVNDFVVGRVDAETFVHGAQQIVRITKHLAGDKPNTCRLEFRFVVSQVGHETIEDWTTSFQLNLRSLQQQMDLFHQVFDSVEFVSTGAGSRGIFMARKPKS